MAGDLPPPLDETTRSEPKGSVDPSSVSAVSAPTELRPLHPALRQVWILSGLLTVLMLAVIVGVTEYVYLSEVETWPLPAFTLAVGLLLVLTAITLAFTSLRYRAWRYAIRPHDVLLHYGVVWRTRCCIPRLRIQHVDIESGPIDRAFGIVKLSLYTAGASSAVATIPGLLPEDAEALRETLLQTERCGG